MVKQQADLRGALHDSYGVVREAGRQEERQRVLIEIVLALDKGKEISWVRDALLELRQHIETPRSKEEQDRLLLASIMAVAIRKD